MSDGAGLEHYDRVTEIGKGAVRRVGADVSLIGYSRTIAASTKSSA